MCGNVCEGECTCIFLVVGAKYVSYISPLCLGSTFSSAQLKEIAITLISWVYDTRTSLLHVELCIY